MFGSASSEAAASPTVGIQNSFTRNVSALLEKVEYRRCDSGEDAEAIYRLRYKAYRAFGFVSPNERCFTTDHLDDAENCYRFGVYLEGNLVSTVRVHHQTRDTPDAPVMSVFGDVLLPRLKAGESFINPSLLAADPEFTRIYKALPYITLRLAVVANNYFQTTSCVCMVRDEHTAFYQRIFGSVQAGDPRSYPPFSVPVYLYDSDCATNLAKTIQRFPFFKATPLEERLLFSKRGHQELPSLTVLPSTKYIRAA
ncbi:hypothetical protein J5Y06_06110 [Tianweitania sediminis]|uniref:N-acyl amino acid synthase FeeM catalytic core domain-containing protein n=1 Tax=Tianweitania sediminis TaxID=1502156 RepID=A0A8J7QYC6_9HYPH|nr:hypothetical protein [Tianweitania sediminis]